MPVGKRIEITIPPGVNKDDTAYSATQYLDADKIRFYRDQPQKIGGWMQLNIDNLVGVPRSMFSWRDNTNVENTMIGTNVRLYVFKQGVLTNITPLVPTASKVAIANSLSTNYNTLANNPIITSAGSGIVTIPFTPFVTGTLQQGDLIQLSGVTGNPGGITNANLTGVFVVNSVIPTAILINAANGVVASSGVTGGGNAVTLGTAVISVAQIAHGFATGDRIKIASATAFDNFLITDLNIEAVIRNVTVNAYDYYSTVAATNSHFAGASLSGQGGAGTTVQGSIAAGICDFGPAEGYGGGLYGAGLYGQGSPFGTGYTLPTIWSFDRFGVNCIMTPGLGTGVYTWDGNIAVAPILLSGAPAAVNYVFCAGRQIVTLGAAGVPNQITTNASSATGSPGTWTPATTNDVYAQIVPNTGRLIAHGYSRGKFLLFAEDSVKSMNYVGGNQIWNLADIMSSDGLLAPKAVISFNDAVIWIGQTNFYKYDGAVVSVLPNNTLRQWFFDNLNQDAYYKVFIHKSVEYNEIWFFFPLLDSKEPNAYIIWNFEEGHFTNGLLTRTSSEIPVDVSREQYLAAGSCDGSIVGTMYQHEIEGEYSDNGNNMTGSLTTNSALLDGGDYLQYIDRIIPSNQLLPLGNPNQAINIYQLNIYSKEYDGQITSRQFPPVGSFQVDTSTQKIETRATGRQWQYKFNFSNQLGFRIEKFYAEIKPTTPR